jgi:undecaprenyl-diphosphatase
MATSLLARLSARDRALFDRWTIGQTAGDRRAWVALTQLGGVWCIMALAGLPLLTIGPLHATAVRAALGLALSHAIVQIIKRSVLRERPRDAVESLVPIPDEFSFPSGHAAAAMALAFAYAIAYPAWALPLLIVAAAVGFSRVRLGVHYPGDVLVGQAIAVGIALLVFSMG